MYYKITVEWHNCHYLRVMTSFQGQTYTIGYFCKKYAEKNNK